MRPHILLIEDDPEDQQTVCEALSQHGCQVATITDTAQAMATVKDWARQYQLVIIEEAMQGRSGLKLLREARSKHCDLPVVMISRDAEWDGYARALSEGAIDYFPRPVDRKALLAVVDGLPGATG